MTALCVHAATRLALGEWEATAPQLHEAAWCLARCLPLISEQEKPSEAYSKELARLLKKAIGSGFKDACVLQRKEFDPLWMRDDFKQVAGLLK